HDVPAGLFQDAGSGVDEDDREVGRGAAGDHVPRVLEMAGRVRDDELAPGSLEVAVGDVDRDPLLAFGAEAVGQQGEIETVATAPAGRVLEQSRRHAFIASLLRIPHLVVCVNKMDLVDWDQSVFDRITAEFSGWLAKLDIHDVTFIPISALHGDNVVDRSERMPWYDGSSLLYHLEHVHVASDRNLRDPRFPVQWVVRPMTDEHHDYRGYAGEVASGVLRTGDEVVVLPSGKTSRIASIDTFEGELDEAYPPLSVTLRLEDDIDVSRGDMICRPENRPTEAREIEAMICWMSERPLSPAARYRIKHTSRTALAKVDEVRYRIDVNSLHRDKEANGLELNEIGRLRLRLSSPLFVDEYRRNRATGSFILIDESTNDTVGAGMVL
ncbi:MAG: bifunctional enzyme CysN/CysC, partial [Thermoleophilaceae bacterium]|nr:bifunctional enzyme CysN/CysC [Thermoleophilaceae bacterium]